MRERERELRTIYTHTYNIYTSEREPFLKGRGSDLERERERDDDE